MSKYDRDVAFASALDIEHADHRQAVPDCAAPAGALTWRTAAERNKRLGAWRRAVFATFAAQPRALRLTTVLKDLFHVREGYAFARNSHLAAEAVLPERTVQTTLAALESRGAITRAMIVAGGKWLRVIYPAVAVIERVAGGDLQGSWRGVIPSDHDPRGSLMNLSQRTPKRPRSERERARRAAALREHKASRRAAAESPAMPSPEGCAGGGERAAKMSPPALKS
jgi:hypothetical protein